MNPAPHKHFPSLSWLWPIVGCWSTSALATSHYVDNVGNCGGLTTCYTTIQAALNQAVADDEIRVFPGTYPEAVDLSLMGSGLGTPTDGNIQFIAVDGNNSATTGTAFITPATGAAFLHSGSFFSGHVGIHGFVVTAVDDDGIDLDLIDGDITISGVTASNNNNDGIDVEVAVGNHRIDISHTITNNNGSSGLNLDGPDGTEVRISQVIANQNTSDGITVFSADDFDAIAVEITDATTNQNSNGNVGGMSAGILVGSTGSLLVNNLVSNNNEGPGLLVADKSSTVITDSQFNENGDGNFSDSGILGLTSGTWQVQRTEFNDNSYAAIDLYNTDLPGTELTAFSVSCNLFSGNDRGLMMDQSMDQAAAIEVHHNQFVGQTTAAMHAGISSDSINATNNWWGDASGPTHANNPGGVGDRVSDFDDDAIGGAMGLITYAPYQLAPKTIRQFPSDTLFANGFDGNPCTQF